MSESARIIFVLDGKRKSAFVQWGGSPLKMGAQILDFIKNRPLKEQKEYIRKLELVNTLDKPASSRLLEEENLEQLLEETTLVELFNMFHDENKRERQKSPDFIYSINYDTRELGYGMSAMNETVFPFEELNETTLETMVNEYEQDIWEDFIDDIKPIVIDDVISFEEQAYTRYKQEFPVVSKRLKKAGYTFDPENGVWSKKSDDANEEIATLISYFDPEEETSDWLEEEE